MSRHLGSLVLAAVLLLATAACSDDAPDDPEPSGSSSDSPSDAPSTPEASAPAPATTESPDPTGPTVTPAAGLELRQGILSVRAPMGWKKSPEPILGNFSEQADYHPWVSTLFIGELPGPDAGAPVDLDELARSAIRTDVALRDPEILEPVELDGVRWYHTSGMIDSATYEDAFGTVTDGVFLRIGLRTGRMLVSAAQREELLASVLATVELDVD